MAELAASFESVREIFSAACRPPPHPSPDATAPTTPTPAAFVLLEPLAYVADRANATTAEATSSTGHTVQVTFCVEDPPGVSYLCVHCPGLGDADFAGRSRVACCERDLLVLSITFVFGAYTSQGPREYFVYKAGPGRPSLRLLPNPYPPVLAAWEIGLVPRGDAGHFVLATLCFTLTPWVFDLHLFSSMTWLWSTKTPQAEVSPAVETGVPITVASKVIQLGGGTLGWVDFWRGIVVCNVLDEMPVVRFIPLPMLMPGNKEGVKTCPWVIRDVACSNGLIKFIEIEKHERQDVDERSYDDVDTLCDSDCLREHNEIGWRAMTWYRMTSWDHWRKGCVAYDEEILVDHPRHSLLLPEPSDDNARELTLKNLLATYPVLSLSCHGDDFVYFLCKSKSGDEKAWLITVDLKKKISVELAPFSIEGYFSLAHPCALSSYMA